MLQLNMNLKKNTPKYVINILNHLMGNDKENSFGHFSFPDNEFFRCDRFKFIFLCDSYYFDGYTNSGIEYDHIDEKYHIVVNSNLKNYDDEIDKFLNWIQPYIDTEGFLGYKRFETCNFPTLIFNDYYKGIKFKNIINRGCDEE